MRPFWWRDRRRWGDPDNRKHALTWRVYGLLALSLFGLAVGALAITR